MTSPDPKPPNPKDSEGGHNLRRAADAVRTAIVPNDSPYPELIGTLVGHKFQIERVLGEGGMAVVVAARHLELDEVVAIKFLRREFRGHADVVERFTYESRAAVRIKSDHVAKVFDVGHDELNGPYIVMEHLEGRDLADVLFDRGRLGVEEAVQYVLQAAEGIAVAHKQGIVHLDLKPDNLFLTRKADGSELVKVLDFGVARALRESSIGGESATASGEAAMGSPAYMAPEQIRFEAPDHRSDLWGLGVVLYQLLTGRQAFSGATPTQTIRNVALSSPTPITTYAPDVPEGLVSAVARCMERNLALRFQNVAELAAALAPYGGKEGRITARQCVAVAMASGQVIDVTIPASLPPPPPVGNSSQPVWEVRRRPSSARWAAPLAFAAAIAITIGVIATRDDGTRPPAAAAAPPDRDAANPTSNPTATVTSNPTATANPNPAATSIPTSTSTSNPTPTSTVALPPGPMPIARAPGPMPTAVPTTAPSASTAASAAASQAAPSAVPEAPKGAVKTVDDARGIGIVD